MPGPGPEVDDPVGVRHDGLVVLDDDDGLAGVHETVQQGEQVVDVGQVQACGGFVEHVDAARFPEVGGELEALALAAGQGGQRLADGEVPEADVGQAPQDGVGRRGAGRAAAEELLGAGDRHAQDLGDVLVPEAVLEHGGLEASALALLAGGGDGVHEAELGVDDAGAVAGGAGALGVGAEQGGLDAVGLGERLADGVEQARVGGRVGAPGPLDRGLVHDDDVVAPGEAAVDQGALAGAGDTGDHAQHAQGDVDVDVAQVVGARPTDLEGAGAGAGVSLRWARSPRWRPVRVSLRRRSSTVPSKQMVPPALPAPGPRSTTWSAMAMVSGLCSTTSTVLPLSRSCSSRSFMRRTSCGCRPMVGSSNT
nr:hypothetical protein GCM10025730_04470 [Promicromonospora thailandica]